jgi:hypothetical protein
MHRIDPTEQGPNPRPLPGTVNDVDELRDIEIRCKISPKT